MSADTNAKTDIKLAEEDARVLPAAVGVLTIDLNAIVQNYRFLQQKTKDDSRVAAVVKADAFGLGAFQIAGALIKAGCQDFFVATPNEGINLREKYKECNIYILNGYFGHQADMYLDYNLTPVLNSLIEIESYAALCRDKGKSLPAILNFNLYMNRLGLADAERKKILNTPDMTGDINVVATMSHFACADEDGHELNDRQFEGFQTVSEMFPEAQKTMSNSSGIFRKDEFHCDMVRTGAALYGLNPSPGQDNPMQSVISLKLPILRTRLVYAGAAVGYNATYTFDTDSWIATVSGGYADGLIRSLSNAGAFYWQGVRCPIRGRISMDLTTIDLSSVPETKRPGPGDFVDVIGKHQTADDLASDAGTIGYEILTSLGKRYDRVYIMNE